jgi:hypothetical protein
MAAVTKNRNFFKWPKLLYFKPECAQISAERNISQKNPGIYVKLLLAM